MKKAVAVALVLIAGAAVVLWFGNRLNSWVLGGLIGGLASLLLSIPISLILFSYFARQHDEQRQYTQVSHKHLRSRRSTSFRGYLSDAGFDDDEYALVDDEVSTVVEEPYRRPTMGRHSGWLDEEFGSRIPPSRQLPSASSRRVTGNVSGRYLPAQHGTQQRKTTPPTYQASDDEEELRGRRAMTRRTGSSGLSGYQQASRFRSNALHTARLEAAKQQMEEGEEPYG